MKAKLDIQTAGLEVRSDWLDRRGLQLGTDGAAVALSEDVISNLQISALATLNA